MADWYYIGHYGQLGPLTQEQMSELVQGGVIVRETYVWRSGMSTWIVADAVPELKGSFIQADPFLAPPPPPAPMMAPPPSPNLGTQAQPFNPTFGQPQAQYPVSPYANNYLTIPSDRSRIAAGVLNILLPFGVGRMYLGYVAYGVLQLVLSFCGIGALWSIIDGIAMLCGSVKYDGYGRHLRD